jgi:hypothetical protein
MGQRSWHRNALQLHGDGIGLRWTNPDGEISLGHFFLENHYSLVIHQAHPNAIDTHLNHNQTSPVNQPAISFYVSRLRLSTRIGIGHSSPLSLHNYIHYVKFKGDFNCLMWYNISADFQTFWQ